MARMSGTVYTVTAPDGQVHTRTSERTYTHAVLVMVPAGHELTHEGSTFPLEELQARRRWAASLEPSTADKWVLVTWCGRLDLATKAARKHEARTMQARLHRGAVQLPGAVHKVVEVEVKRASKPVTDAGRLRARKGQLTRARNNHQRELRRQRTMAALQQRTAWAESEAKRLAKHDSEPCTTYWGCKPDGLEVRVFMARDLEEIPEVVGAFQEGAFGVPGFHQAECSKCNSTVQASDLRGANIRRDGTRILFMEHCGVVHQVLVPEQHQDQGSTHGRLIHSRACKGC